MPPTSQTHGQSLLGSDQASQLRIGLAAGLGGTEEDLQGAPQQGKLAESERSQSEEPEQGNLVC